MIDRYFKPLCLLLGIMLCAGCENKKNISDRLALDLVESYLEANPVYDTGSVPYGEIKLRQRGDSVSIAQLRALEKGGYIHMQRIHEKKRFLSKDSVFTFKIQLLDAASPFVLEKTDKKITVKSATYSLDEAGGVMVEQSGKSRAKATVSLRRNVSDFWEFADKKADPNASFIKKTYSLKYIPESGWEVYK